MSEYSEAAEVLGRTARLESSARRQGGGWYLRYLLAFGGVQLFFVPAVLLWHEPAAFAVTMALYVSIVIALSVYASRQPAVRRRFGLRHSLTLAAWAAMFTTSMALGTSLLRDSVPFAVAATAACVAPVAVAALLERRARA
ncbi:hypothetical protein ACIRSU_05140 [Streptomyces sp. NPDC101160]|uniref:hypothetical protein n=1 Tax=Streptomyces sp. NPDC101160 TaxID=3366118 RepID=UPI003809D44A